MTPATARKLIARAGELAALPFPIHPHMLRHSAGYKVSVWLRHLDDCALLEATLLEGGK
jgi:integrase